MRKILKGILAIGCVTLLSFGTFGCSKVINAYDIAVKNGFQGTEEEWLRSLHGANGADGKDFEAEELYQTAVEKGYEGSFLDFCATLNITIPNNNDTNMIAENARSVVSVFCSYTITTDGSFLNPGTKQYGAKGGSGVIIHLNKEAGNALIVTNYHIVYEKDCDQGGILDDIWVYPYGAYNRFSAERTTQVDDGIKATYVGGAMDYDIAILKVEGSEYIQKSALTAATMGDSDKVKPGEQAFAIGNPAGAGIAVTDGIVSVPSEYIKLAAFDNRDIDRDGYVDAVRHRVIRTSAAINAGNSGGGLFNAKGELIGVVNAKEVGSKMDNMGYAIPTTLVKAIIDNILANGDSVHRATLGITTSVTSSKAVVDEHGQLSVQEEFMIVTSSTSPFKEKLRVGSLFVSAKVNDGETLMFTREYQLAYVLLSVRKGDTVTFVMRNSSGGESKVVITFDKDEYFTVWS